jgi:UDP-3-O-[3-hydroxymyristoyl] glucosamine N-acyltransferase
MASLIETAAEPALMGRLISRIGELDLKTTALASGVRTNFARAAIHVAVSSEFPDASFPSTVHQTAWLAPSAESTDGVTLLAHSSVGPNASLELGSPVNTGATLDHNGELGDFASLGSGARTGGNVKKGARTMIGLRAGILQGRTVSEGSLVGAQSLVLEDIPSLSVAIGSPCRVIRSSEQDAQYY